MTEIGAITRSKPGSVSSAIASYYASAAFTKNLAPTSQAVRKHVLEAFRREHGDKLIRAMPTKFLRPLLDAMEPTTAKNWLAAIRALTAHAIKSDLIEHDPTLGIKLRRMNGAFHTWTEEEIERFESAHPVGSRERLAFALGLFTAQRRGGCGGDGAAAYSQRPASRHAAKDRQGASDPDPSRPASASSPRCQRRK